MLIMQQNMEIIRDYLCSQSCLSVLLINPFSSNESFYLVTTVYKPRHLSPALPVKIKKESLIHLGWKAYDEVHALFNPLYTHRNKILEVAIANGYSLQEKDNKTETYTRETNESVSTLVMNDARTFPTVTVTNNQLAAKNFSGLVGNRVKLRAVLRCIK